MHILQSHKIQSQSESSFHHKNKSVDVRLLVVDVDLAAFVTAFCPVGAGQQHPHLKKESRGEVGHPFIWGRKRSCGACCYSKHMGAREKKRMRGWGDITGQHCCHIQRRPPGLTQHKVPPTPTPVPVPIKADLPNTQISDTMPLKHRFSSPHMDVGKESGTSLLALSSRNPSLHVKTNR